MFPFMMHTPQTTSQPVSGLLTSVEKKVGFLPNVFSVMAGSSAALTSFVDMNRNFMASTLTQLEQEIVQMAASVENGCNYCISGHTAFAQMRGVEIEIIYAVRRKETLEDPKLEALRQFTVQLVVDRGRFTDMELKMFLDAGYGVEQVFEVILGIAVKTMSNLTSNLCQISLDEAFECLECKSTVFKREVA